jgi:glutamate synthase (NADPH/NADH) small chain
MVRDLGVEFRQKTAIGRDVSFTQLEEDFDAIFIGIGLGETDALALPGENLVGVRGAIEFIEETKLGSFDRVQVGRRVACIGAGNTAIDVVTAAKRLGAETVHLIYRRGEKEMSAFRYEYELAKLDGVVFHWFAQPTRVIGENGNVAGIECVRTRLERDASGEKVKVSSIPGTEFKLDVDMVVRAIGQKPVTEILRGAPGIEVRADGTVAVNDRHQTGHQKYFAGGDCVNGGKEVVDAVADGMAAARGIDSSLGAPRGKN